MTTKVSCVVPDEALVAACQRGETDAFASLYRRHAPAVAAAARARGARADGVADVVQETFTRAMAHLDHLREPSRFRSWLLAIARNVTTDEQRIRHDLPSATETTGVDGRLTAVSEQLADTEPSPAEVAELVELGELLRDCLAGLSRRDATALTMVTQLGFTTAEVGDVLGTGASATKVLLHRARRRLRDAVTRELLAREGATGCAGFNEALRDPEDGTAIRHVRSCATCQAHARRQLDL